MNIKAQAVFNVDNSYFSVSGFSISGFSVYMWHIIQFDNRKKLWLHLKSYFILQAVKNNTINQWSVDLLFVLFFFLYEMFNSMSTVHPSNNWPRSTHQHYTTCLNSVHSTIRKFDKLCKCLTWRPHLFQYLLFLTSLQ